MKSQIVMPIAIVVILIAVLIPLPSIVLDLLISANISLSVVILLSSVYLLNPVQFSSFPSILLLTTLFRLSLNIASTRLILLHGSTGMNAAGGVIQAFGQFVVGGNYAVGIVIFLVLIVIQYVVINHGAVRISEVHAGCVAGQAAGDRCGYECWNHRSTRSARAPSGDRQGG